MRQLGALGARARCGLASEAQEIRLAECFPTAVLTLTLNTIGLPPLSLGAAIPARHTMPYALLAGGLIRLATLGRSAAMTATSTSPRQHFPYHTLSGGACPAPATVARQGADSRPEAWTFAVTASPMGLQRASTIKAQGVIYITW